MKWKDDTTPELETFTNDTISIESVHFAWHSLSLNEYTKCYRILYRIRYTVNGLYGSDNYHHLNYICIVKMVDIMRELNRHYLCINDFLNPKKEKKKS